MWSWWNSLESVSKFNSVIQLAIIVFGLITAFAMFLGYKASKQIAYLQSKEKKEMKSKINELEIKQTPRRISDQQKAIIVKELTRFTGAKISINVISGDTDNFDYAKDFISSFKAAGWEVNETHSMVIGKKCIGIELIIKDNKNPPFGFIALYNVMKQVGIQFNGFYDLKVPADMIQMVIGNRQ